MFYQTKHVIHTASPAQSFMTVLPSAVLVKWYQHPAVLCPIVLFSVSRFLNFVGKKSENYFIICAYLNELNKKSFKRGKGGFKQIQTK